MYENREEEFSKLLLECEKEKVHLTQNIQPYGHFLGFNQHNQLITHYSSHIHKIFPVKIQAGATNLAAVLGDKAAQVISQAAAFEGGYLTPWLELPMRQADLRCYGLIFKTDQSDILGLDLEVYDSSENDHENCVTMQISSKLSRLIHASTESLQLSVDFAESFRKNLDFDRVMIYHFDEEWNGEVVAESQSQHESISYLGLHWPASDIPAQVRALMLLNRSRVIVDRDYQPMPIESVDQQSMDQSLGSLRSISPIHIQYLKNMNVRSTFTLPLLTEGKLWGLVACHHQQVKIVHPKLRMACEILVDCFAQKHLHLNRLEESRQRYQAERKEVALHKALSQSKSVLDFFEKNCDFIKNMVSCDGLVIIYSGTTIPVGDILLPNDLNRLLAKLRAMKRTSSFISKQISTLLHFKDEQDLAGLAAFPLAVDKSSWIIWLRKECRQAVRWAGAKTHEVKYQNGQAVLEPRSSFADWYEKKKDQSLPWNEREVALMRRLVAFFIFAIAKESDELAKRLLSQASELQNANEYLKQFSCLASHDLKSPITAISGFCQILEKKEANRLSEKGSYYLSRIHEQAKYMNSLLNNLFVHAMTHYAQVQFEEVDLQNLCANVAFQFQIELDQLNAQIEFENLPVVRCDPIQFHQMFSNFLENSLKFRSEERNLVIRVRADRQVNAWLIQWMDNGIGIPEEFHQSIFQLFSRDTSRKKVAGTGIGLSICKRIVEMHHGQIWVSPSLDAGTTINILLPDTEP